MLTHYFGALRRLSRNVLLYLAATALIGLAFDGGVFTVLFNLYLLRLGFGPEFIGQVNSAGLLAFALSSLPAGPLGTKLGTRRVMIGGLALMGAGGIFIPVADLLPPNWVAGTVFTVWIAMFIGLALYFVNAVPFVMEIANDEERSQAFSLQTALLSLAAFSGALLGGFLPRFFAGWLAVDLQSPAAYRFPLMISAAFMLLSIWIILRVRPAVGTSQPEVQPIDDSPVPIQVPIAPVRVGRLLASPVLITILLLSTVRFFQVSGIATSFTFFNVYMDAHLLVPPEQIGIISALARLLGVALALATPLFIQRWGAPGTVLVASAVATLSLLPLALVATPWAAGLGYVGVTAFASMRFPAFMVYSMSLVPANWRGTLAGAGEFSGGLSFAAMAFAGGYLISAQGYPALFLTGLALTLIGTLLFFVWYVVPERAKRAPEPLPSGPAA